MSIFKNRPFYRQSIDYGDQKFFSVEHVNSFESEALPFCLSWCGYESFFKNSFIEREGMDFFEIILTTDGSAEIVLGKEKYVCSPSTLIVSNAQMPHSYKVSGGMWKYKYLQIYGSGVDKYCALFSKKQFTLPDAEQFDEIFEKIMSKGSEKSFETDIAISELICRLLCRIYLLRNISINSPEPLFYRSKINHAIKQIENEYMLSLDIEKLAESVGFSKAALFRYFKKFTDTTPYKYQLNIRVSHAKKMLQTNDWKIKEISEKIGFKNVQNFNKIFKGLTGVSPREYRKRFHVEIF